MIISNNLYMHILGRKEILIFFYLYMVVSVLELLLNSNIIQMSYGVYPVREQLRHDYL
jgi:hypothetical protein